MARKKKFKAPTKDELVEKLMGIVDDYDVEDSGVRATDAIRALSEIGKILGHYAPEKIETTIAEVKFEID